MTTDIEVYMAAPEKARRRIRYEQERHHRLVREAREFGMPRDTFEELRDQRDESIISAIAEAIREGRRMEKS